MARQRAWNQRSSGHQDREVRLVQDRPRDATQHPLSQVGVAIRAHDKEIRTESSSPRQQKIVRSLNRLAETRESPVNDHELPSAFVTPGSRTSAWTRHNASTSCATSPPVEYSCLHCPHRQTHDLSGLSCG